METQASAPHPERPIVGRWGKAAITVLAIWAAFIYFQANARIDKVNDTLACFTQAQFDRAESGLPANAYYKAHPDELEAQLLIIAAQRKQAISAWGKCKNPFVIDTGGQK